ncbi:hypothetical protein EMPG_14293 [Blastomyces silverae]|uniref:Uncharacterized protein n=1 Tax=Blastomyces silverae TaxID=2060906 RepID=A0A0H1BFT9_9EURO|nr:hypothetical protein EMPG_14293 [Blastomyces silverae]
MSRSTRKLDLWASKPRLPSKQLPTTNRLKASPRRTFSKITTISSNTSTSPPWLTLLTFTRMIRLHGMLVASLQKSPSRSSHLASTGTGTGGPRVKMPNGTRKLNSPSILASRRCLSFSRTATKVARWSLRKVPLSVFLRHALPSSGTRAEHPSQ